MTIRYRALDPLSRDYQFGRAGTFLVDSPQAVAQAIETRLALWAGEWFLDSQEGVPWVGSVLGHGTQATRDVAVKQHILDTLGVASLDAYASAVGADRTMRVTAKVTTTFGPATVTA